MNRDEIAARVDELAERLEGPELVEAVRGFGAELEPRERELLGEILIERANERSAADYPRWTERMRAARWRAILLGRDPPAPR